MRKFFYFTLVSIMVVAISGCSNFIQKRIATLTFTATQISESDYNNLNYEGFKGAKREDFTRIEMDLDINSETFYYLYPNIEDNINRKQKIVVNSDSSKNIGEIKQSVVIYSKGMSQDDIKNFFTDSFIEIEYMNNFKKSDTIKINLKDSLQFN